MEDSGRRRGCLPARTRRAFTRSPAVPPAHQACSAGPPERPQGAWPVAIVDGFAGVAATVCCGGRRRGRQSVRWRRLPDEVFEQRSCSGNGAALVDCDDSVERARSAIWKVAPHHTLPRMRVPSHAPNPRSPCMLRVDHRSSRASHAAFASHSQHRCACCVTCACLMLSHRTSHMAPRACPCSLCICSGLTHRLRSVLLGQVCFRV